MMRTILVLALALAPALALAGRPQLHWRDTAMWDRSIAHSIDFFDRHAWDEASGSYASEIAVDGAKKSETRHLIATSRMVYGLAHGSRVDAKYLARAKRLA